MTELTQEAASTIETRHVIRAFLTIRGSQKFVGEHAPTSPGPSSWKFWRLAHAPPDFTLLVACLSLPFPENAPYLSPKWHGVVAQLVERLVRNEKVRGSNPLGSTILDIQYQGVA